MGVTLSTPVPTTGWGNDPGKKTGATKLKQTFAQAPGGFGVGQSENIDFSNMQAQAPPSPFGVPVNAAQLGITNTTGPNGMDVSPTNPVLQATALNRKYIAGGNVSPGQELGAMHTIASQGSQQAADAITQPLPEPIRQPAADALGMLVNPENVGFEAAGTVGQAVGGVAGSVGGQQAAKALGLPDWAQSLAGLAGGVGGAGLADAAADPGSIAGKIARGPLGMATGAAGDGGSYMHGQAPKPSEFLAQQAKDRLGQDPAEWAKYDKLKADFVKTGDNATWDAMRAQEDVAKASVEPTATKTYDPFAVEPGTEAAQTIADGAAAAVRPSRAKLTSVQRDAMLAEAEMRGIPQDVRDQLQRAFASGEVHQGNAAKYLDTMRGKVTVPKPEQVKQALAAGPQAAKKVVKDFSDELPNLKPGQAAEALTNIRAADPAIFEKQGVPGLVTEASAAAKGGDVETAKTSVGKAETAVKQTRQAAKDKAVVAAGGTPKPPKPPKPNMPEPGPLPPPDATVVENLSQFPQDIQDSVVTSLFKKHKLNVGQVAGFASGAYYGYNQDPNDDMTHKIVKGLLYGEAGLRVGHVVAGGAARDIPNRAVAMYTRQLLSPKTLTVAKFTTDAAGTIIAPIVRGLAATVERGPGAQQVIGAAAGAYAGYNTPGDAPAGMDPQTYKVLKAIAGGTLGIGATHSEAVRTYIGYSGGVMRGAKAWAKAYDPAENLGTAYEKVLNPATGKMELTKRATEEPSLGQWTGSFLARTISGMTDFAQNLHESAAAFTNAPILAKKEAELTSSISVRSSIAKLKADLEPVFAGKGSPEQKSTASFLESEHPDLYDKAASGMWDDPELAAKAHDMNVTEQLNAWQQKNLPSPRKVAEEWTLTSDPKEGGIVGRGSYSLLSSISRWSPKIPGTTVDMPIGRLIAPFTKVVSNAADQFINFVPLLGAGNQVANEYGTAKASMSAAKQVIGAGLFAIGFGLVGNGATDGGPTDQNKLIQLIDRTGFIPNSVKLPNGWTPIKDLPAPVQPLFRAMGALNGWNRDGMKDQGLGMQVQFALKELFNAVGDSTAFPGLIQEMTALIGTPKAFEQEAGFQLSGLAGSTLGTASEAMRHTVPDTSGNPLLDPLKARLPGFANQLPDKLNRFANPTQNPQEGVKSLLGSFAGKETPTDKDLEPYLDPKIGTGLTVMNDTTFHPGISALPMPPDILRTTKQGTAMGLKKATAPVMNDPRFKAMDDTKKKATLAKIEANAHDTAFFSAVNAYGRDKYLQALPPDKQSQFKYEELAHQVAIQKAAVPYAMASGKPVDPATAAKYADALTKYGSNPNKANIPIYKEAVNAQKYASAAAVQKEASSPDFPDYVLHDPAILGFMTPQQKQQFAAGQLPIWKTPKPEDAQTQLQRLARMRYYDALPAGPQKTALAPWATAWKKLDLATQLKKDAAANSLSKLATPTPPEAVAA